MLKLQLYIAEELQARATFYDLHGPNLPEDLCQYVTNLPTEWKITSFGGEYPEDLPDLDEDLLDEASYFLLYMTFFSFPTSLKAKKQLSLFRGATTSMIIPNINNSSNPR